jgi:phosphoribosylformylglycinamidine synthase
MGAACRHFGTPVTGGNVSFYNQTAHPDGTATAVFPTPTIGMVGVLEHRDHHTSLNFKEKGELIFLLGEVTNDLGSSEYLANLVGVRRSPAPHFNLEAEGKLHTLLREAAVSGVLSAAHDVADGGLFVTLLEMAMPSGLGFDVVTDDDIRLDAFLFGEGQGRAVVSCTEDAQDELLDLLERHSVPSVLLGHVTKGKLQIDGHPFGMCEEWRNTYDNALAEELEA